MTQTRCTSCYTDWKTAMWRPRRSKSRPKQPGKRKEQNNLSPFRKAGSKKEDAPWVASSPMPRTTELRLAAKEAKETSASSEAKKSKDGDTEVEATNAAMKEQLKTYLASSTDLDPSIKTAIESLIKVENDGTSAGVRHAHLNKVDALKKSITKLQDRVKDADQEWLKFKSIMKKKYQEQRDGYRQQRKTLSEALSKKALEYQDAVHELKKRANAEQNPMQAELLSEEHILKLLQDDEPWEIEDSEEETLEAEDKRSRSPAMEPFRRSKQRKET